MHAMKKTIPYKINIFLGILILTYSTQLIGSGAAKTGITGVPVAEEPSSEAPAPVPGPMDSPTIFHRKKWYQKAKDAIVSSGTKIKNYWNADKMSNDISALKEFIALDSNFETEETKKDTVAYSKIDTLKFILSNYAPMMRVAPTKTEIEGIIDNLEKAHKNKILKNRGITIGTSIGGVGLLGLGAVAITKGIKKGFKNIFK